MTAELLANLSLFIRNGGFLLVALFAWLVFAQQRDVLETTETASRIVVGTIIVVLQLAYYTALALILFVPSLRSTPWNKAQWGTFFLCVAHLLPLAVTLAAFVLQPRLFRHNYSPKPVPVYDPVHREVAELGDRIGLHRAVQIWQVDVLIRSPFIFYPLFGRPALILSPYWPLIPKQYAPDDQTIASVRRFFLLHELAHVRHGDALFMTWASAFLTGYRLWAPAVMLGQLTLLLLRVVPGPAIVSIKFSIAATLIIYPLFQVLYLSVSRERELLADARAQLYLGQDQLALLLQRSTLFKSTTALAAPAPHRHTFQSRLKGALHALTEMIQQVVEASSLLSVLPAMGMNAFGTRSFLATHPPIQVRYRMLLEHSILQSRLDAISPSIARWVGILVGVFVAFLLMPFFHQCAGLLNSSTELALLMWGGLLTMLYPTLALCLPLRNTLVYVQPLFPRIGRLLWLSCRAGLWFVVILALGYAITLLAFAPSNSGMSIFELYVGRATMGVVLSPFLSAQILVFMQCVYHVFDRQHAPARWWFSLMTVLLVGVILFLLRAGSSAWSPSYTLLVFMAIGVGLSLGLLTFGRLITDDIDFQQQTITVYWNGRPPRIWHFECRNRASHLCQATLTTFGLLGLVAVLPAYLAKMGLDALYRAFPISIESFLAQLALLAALLAFIFVALGRVDRIAPHLAEGINKRQALLRDTAQFSEVSTALNVQSGQMPKALSYCVPAELLSIQAGLPSMSWWIPAMPLETIDWACRLVVGHYGAGSISPAAIDYVKACACSTGGFGLWPGGSPRLDATYHALHVLNTVESLGPAALPTHVQWILRCGDVQGGFRSPEHRLSSLQDLAYAVQALALLGCLDAVDQERCTEWTKRAWLHSDRGLEETSLAATILATLKALSPDFLLLLEDSWLPRYWSLVTSMRVDKQIDHVWNYMRVVSCLFEPSSVAFVNWTDGLIARVSEAQTAFLNVAM